MSRKQAQEKLSEAEQKYRTLVEQIPGVVYISPINTTAKEAYISPQLQQLLGIAPEDWNHGFLNSWLDYTHPDDRDRYWQAVDTAIATGEPLNIEYRMIRHDGRTIWVRNQANLVLCADGQTQVLQGLVFDITERKQVEAALQESEARYRAILEDQTELIARCLPDGIVTFVNEAFCRFFGLKREEIITHHYEPVVFEEDRERVFSLVNSISLENPVITIENRVIACQGVRWTQWVIRGIFDQQGTIVELQSVGRDITDRKLVEQALSENEQKFRAIFNQTIHFIGLLQPDGIVLEANQTALEFAGITRKEVVGKPFWEGKWWTISPKTQAQLKTAIASAANGESIRYEVDVLGRDHRVMTIDFSLRPILDETGRVSLLISEGRDISEYQAALRERHKAEEALRSSQDFLQKIANTVPHILYLFDLLQGTSIYLNEQSVAVLGYSAEEICQADPQWFINCFHPDDQHLCYDLPSRFVNLSDNEVISTEYRFRHKNGEWRWLNTREVIFARDGSGTPTQILGSVEDISTRKQVEGLLRQQAEGERLITEVTQQIRQSLNLEEVLHTTVNSIRQCLGSDSVAIYQLESDGSGNFAAESVGNDYPQRLEHIMHPFSIKQDFSGYYQGLPTVLHDIQESNFSADLLELLELYQIKAAMVVPILNGEHLWGLLIAHQCAAPRYWQAFEVNLLQQLARQVAIAIHQSVLYQQVQAANEELQRLATLDGLTQIANRRRFDEYLEDEWHRLKREQAPLSLILFDVDFFKRYNDTYGHLAGDDCLRQLGSTLKSIIKRPADLVARYGGEEFAVILPNTEIQGAIYVAQTIRQAVRNLAIPHAQSSVCDRVTVSLGVVSIVPNSEISPQDLINAADKALYLAKQQGRDQVHAVCVVIPS
ncbi:MULTISPECIES: PAS domain S-box protein [Nostoc]|uniref:PAS domain S-box protein n=2 Tax=Nostoc TaxID=1177 RepID=A0ABR8I3D0_9NOSO|nr:MULTISPECIES: PAS domain S-box protein [Nostoc]MBD2560219.1 PAS domain S-box protein [Nostoc linckia FACHB-391]MBD2645875.1 PAS domain S-box protein [Nostoc foliaceum FACHB-393]